jgi:hypothetical protein
MSDNERISRAVIRGLRIMAVQIEDGMDIRRQRLEKEIAAVLAARPAPGEGAEPR